MRRIGAPSSLEAPVSTLAHTAPARDRSLDWRELWLVLAVANGVFVVATTEVLSLFQALTADWLRLLWLGWAVVLALVFWRRRSIFQWRLRRRSVVLWRPRRRFVVRWLKGSPPASHLVVLGGLAAIVLLTAVVAWFAPPNTSDAMSYHLSRVANWAQNRSVADYPTPTLLQLYQPPWAEFAILHLQLLSQSDRFANFVQFASMLTAIVSASYISRLLGGGVRSQLLAAVFVGALPMGVLQASSTQNDYVEAMWLSVFAASVLLVVRGMKVDSWRPYALAEASLGLAVCTKGTSYFYAGPFVLLLAGGHLPRLNRTAVARLSLVAVVAVLINVGQLGRNVALFHSPLGPIAEEADGAGYQVAEVRWNGVVSNIVRNVGMQLGTPFGPINDAISDEISWIHERLGIWQGSPITTWPDTQFDRSTLDLTLHESTAGNLLATMLIVASVVFGCAGTHRGPVAEGLDSPDRGPVAAGAASTHCGPVAEGLDSPDRGPLAAGAANADRAPVAAGAASTDRSPLAAGVASAEPAAASFVGAVAVARDDRTVFLYALAWAAGLLGFSMLLRWQPWGSRLQLPWFVLAGPLVSVVLSRRQTRAAWLALVVVLLLAATPWALQHAQSATRRDALGVGLLIGAALVLLYLRRRQLVALASALDMATASRQAGRTAWLALDLVLLVGVLPYALANQTRPLLGPHSVLTTSRTTQSFVVLPDLEQPYRDATARVQSLHCDQIGLLLRFRDWDYPLWLMLRGPADSNVQLEYVNVANVSAGLPPPTFVPCAIISTAEVPRGGLEFAARTYQADQPLIGGLNVLVPKS